MTYGLLEIIASGSSCSSSRRNRILNQAYNAVKGRRGRDVPMFFVESLFGREFVSDFSSKRERNWNSEAARNRRQLREARLAKRQQRRSSRRWW